MLKNPIALAVLAVIVIAGGVWLYFYETNPLHSSCRKIMADWQGTGLKTADAVYDSLSDRAKAKTTREGTRMYIDTACRTETTVSDVTIAELRDRLERNLSAESSP